MYQHLLMVLLAVMLCATRKISAMADQPQVGERYPDFTLPNIDDGKAVSLSDYHGKKVLLIQFASW